MSTIAVTGSFDDLRSRHMRLLQEAAEIGPVHVQLWPDAMIHQITGQPPKFPESERLYVIEALRYVTSASIMPMPTGDLEHALSLEPRADIWVVHQDVDHPTKRQFAAAHNIDYRVITEEKLQGFPLPVSPEVPPKKDAAHRVLITGCYDYLHSGHVRFFEEASEYGELFVGVGHDANLRLLKGPGRPMFPQNERQFMVQSIRHVARAVITSGHGWMDADPEIRTYKPDRYLVNEDGDNQEKRDYCAHNGLEYIVLKRLPKPGLPRRESTKLRGF